MQKRSFLVVTMFLVGMFLTGIYAQTITVSGSVTSKEMSDPLIGVNVLVKGTTNGTVTDLNGHYSITVGPDDVLVFSYISMQTVEEAVKGRKVIDVSMVSDTESLGEVVVTAMGIQRQSETLTYSAQTVGGSDVNDIKSVNMINSLQGKSAGLMITPNSTGAGGSSKILFRGNKSISGSNQPLIVVDGVPVMNSVSGAQVSSNYGGERDGGDVMSTINPDDIAVIQDDMDMPVGQLRIRRKGSAGGHNGIKSITEHLGTDAYPRFKIGIGHPARNNKAVVNHVLHAFQGEDKTAIEAAVAEMATALEEWIKSGDIEEVMQAHNKKKPKAEKPAAE